MGHYLYDDQPDLWTDRVAVLFDLSGNIYYTCDDYTVYFDPDSGGCIDGNIRALDGKWDSICMNRA